MNIEQLKKDYWEFVNTRYKLRYGGSFYETYHSKHGENYVHYPIRTSYPTLSKEERDELLFENSIILFNLHYPHHSPLSEKDEKELLGVFISKVSNTEGSKVS